MNLSKHVVLLLVLLQLFNISNVFMADDGVKKIDFDDDFIADNNADYDYDEGEKVSSDDIAYLLQQDSVQQRHHKNDNEVVPDDFDVADKDNEVVSDDFDVADKDDPNYFGNYDDDGNEQFHHRDIVSEENDQEKQFRYRQHHKNPQIRNVIYDVETRKNDIKTSSNGHSTKKNDIKTSSNGHSTRKNHIKTSSNGHSTRKNHIKTSSNGHSTRKNHIKTSSNGHSTAQLSGSGGKGDSKKRKRVHSNSPVFCWYRTRHEGKRTCYGDMCVDVIITKFIQECITI